MNICVHCGIDKVTLCASLPSLTISSMGSPIMYTADACTLHYTTRKDLPIFETIPLWVSYSYSKSHYVDNISSSKDDLDKLFASKTVRGTVNISDREKLL